MSIRIPIDFFYKNCTGCSLSEAFIFASINLKYDARLLVELRVQYIIIFWTEKLIGPKTPCTGKSLSEAVTHNMTTDCSLNY